jgi:carbonic anhydrase
MTDAFSDVLDANAAYADRHGPLEPPPAGAGRGLAVLTCVDARIDPLTALGLAPGEAMVLRNPGAQVTGEALNALVVCVHRLGVERILVMGHTDCGMTKADDESVRREITEATGQDASELPIGMIADQQERLAADVERLRDSPFLPADIAVAGGVLDLRTGRLDLL